MANKTDAGMKRKRHADGPSNPSKRVAVEDRTQIKISLQEADEWAPLIASTPGLAVPTSLTLKPYTKTRENAPKRPGRSDNIATKELLLHSSEHPKLEYIAREEEEGESETLLKHYIGVCDSETGKLEVMEARKMIVRGSVRAHQATPDDTISTNMREQRNTLGQMFGTKKAKKAIASVTENAISPDKSARNLAPNGTTKIDSVAAAMLADMAESTAGMATREQLQQAADAAKPRPKANLKTQDITQVYTIDELVGIETLKLIPVRQWQKVMKDKNEVIVTSRFVANRLRKFSDNVEKLKLLRYLLLLLDFFNASRPGRGGRSLPKRDELKTILGEMPEAVLEGVKRKFAEGFVMSKFKADLLLTYICALACVIENYEVDTWDLKEDLKVEVNELSKYFKEIGAKVSAFPDRMRKQMGMDKALAAQRRVAKLKIPLDFPKVGFGRRVR